MKPTVLPRYTSSGSAPPASYEQRRLGGGKIEWILCAECKGPTEKRFPNRPVSIGTTAEKAVTAREAEKTIISKTTEQKSSNEVVKPMAMNEASGAKRMAVFFPEGHADIARSHHAEIIAKIKSEIKTGQITMIAYAWDEGTKEEMIKLAKDREAVGRELLSSLGITGKEISSIAAIEKVAPSRVRLNRTDGSPGAMYRRLDIAFGE